MKLTPLKVRGKRTTSAPKKRRLGDLRTDEAIDAPRKFRKRPIKKSLLEREIPLEIMERFFILSENMNFPLCSPLLGRLLSGRHTLVAVIMAAFGPTWEVGFGVRLIEDCWSFRGQGAPLGNSAFQSSILACRWATVELILETQQQWGRRYAKDFTDEVIYPPPLKPGSMSQDVVDTRQLHGDVHSIMPPPDFGPLIQRCNPGGRGYRRMLAGAPTGFPKLRENLVSSDGTLIAKLDVRTSLEVDLQLIRESILSCSNAKAWEVPSEVPFYLDVHPRTRIPHHLVTGPWDQEQVLKLIWLRRGGAVLDESQTWELRQKGFRNAFYNAKASGATDSLVAYLFLLGDFFWEFDFAGDNVRFEGKRCAWPQHVMVQMHNELVDEDPSCIVNKMLNDLEAALKHEE